MKKIIIFGCQQITVDIIKYLHLHANIDLLLLVTYEIYSDVSRGQESVITVAKKLGIKTISPKNITKDLIKKIKKFEPDLIISAYYRKILPKNLIDIPKRGCINIHPSLLPNYRGPVPTAWAILKGEKVTGITIHKIDQGVDTGEILLQSKFKILKNETGYDLYIRAMKKGADLFIKNFDKIINNKIRSYPQSSGGSYYGKLKTKIFIDWRESAESIKNLVRVRAAPYNPAEALLDNKYFFINKVSIYINHNILTQMPGKIIEVLENDRIVVSCSNGAIVFEDYDVYPPFSEIEKLIYLKKGKSFTNK